MLLVLFSIFIIFFLFNSKIYIKSFNDNYISIQETQCVNGIFIIIVFFSHFSQYIVIDNQLDSLLYKGITIIGQLMVTTFLFYSGYGIFESIKNKKDYLKKFFKKRFLPTYINFILAVSLFLMLNLFYHNDLSVLHVLLSYIGWDNLGNSNWYMFDVFILYIFVMIIGIIKTKGLLQIILMSLFTLLFAFVLSYFKEGYWVNTIMCFPAGMWFSYYRKRFDKYLTNNKNWLISIIILTVALFAFRYLNHILINAVFYNLVSISFVLLLVILTKKIELKSQVFAWFGKYLFWIYILQRLSMIIFKGRFNNFVYFILCFIITIILTFIFGKISDVLKRKVG